MYFQSSFPITVFRRCITFISEPSILSFPLKFLIAHNLSLCGCTISNSKPSSNNPSFKAQKDHRLKNFLDPYQIVRLTGVREVQTTMIRAVIVMNTQGKPRFAKFYDFQPVEKQQELIRSIYGVLCSRADNVSNFVDAESIFGPDSRLVYKHFATLYFVFVFNSSENELAMLDLIQVFVETLDKCLKNVCELDLVFNYSKMHTILDEIISGGQVLETSSSEVTKAVEEISKLETASNSINFVSKTVSGWRG